MTVFVYCDIGGVLTEAEESRPLLDKLEEMKNEGACLVLATDMYRDSARCYLTDLKTKNNQQLFSFLVARDDLEYKTEKHAVDYWTFALQETAKQLTLAKQMKKVKDDISPDRTKVIFIDDNLENVKNAREAGIHGISALILSRVAPELEITYRRMVMQPL